MPKKKTTIDIDDELIMELRELTGIQDVSEIVDLALRELLKQCKRKKLLALSGKGVWEGNLDELRKGRF